MKLILLGPPGAGKGTQGEILSKKLGVPVISTGNILRAAMRDGTQVGRIAKEYVDKGELVPDDVIIRIIQERLAESDCKNGYILDGVPRTLEQAVEMDAMGVIPDKVLLFEAKDESIVNRMSGRRVCPKCSKTYHIKNNPPAVENLCDACGETLSVRKDDHEEVVLSRLNTYHKETEPLVQYYKGKGKLIEISEMPDIQQTTAELMKKLGL